MMLGDCFCYLLIYGVILGNGFGGLDYGLVMLILLW